MLLAIFNEMKSKQSYGIRMLNELGAKGSGVYLIPCLQNIRKNVCDLFSCLGMPELRLFLTQKCIICIELIVFSEF